MISCLTFIFLSGRAEDKLFREGYASNGGNRSQQCLDKEFVTHDWVEPTFDAADIIRCGEDVFVLHGLSCNMAGFEWIKRTLGRRGVRAHQVHHPIILNPNHIDASIMPLRPGLLLATPPVIDDCKVGMHFNQLDNCDIFSRVNFKCDIV